ncbi:MAG TPA: AAA family ATPase [Tepidisphaeraceae bacterium]|nr:AAA family ATPase [Tepidisphaeraceae bacterium]
MADPFSKGPGAEHVEPVFKRVHRLLRGRYLRAIILGSILAMVGAFAGYQSTQPLWTCGGMIQIKMSRDVVLFSVPENQTTQSPEVIKETQIALMRSQRVIAKAMDSDEWKRLNRPLTDDSIADFFKKLTISSQGRSEMIGVSFIDPDPTAASAAVKGVLTAYNGLYVEAEVKSEQSKRRVLDGRRTDLVRERDDKRDQILVIANAYEGADDLRAVHQSRVADLTKLQSAIAELKMTIGALGSAEPATTQPVRRTPAEMTVVDIEQVDGVMRQLRRDLSAIERDAHVKLTTLGQRNPRYEEARLMVELKKEEIQTYATEWRAAATANAQHPGPYRPGDAAPVTLDQLKFREAEYMKMQEKLQGETLTLGRKMLQIEKLKREVADADAAIAETEHRLTQLRMEQGPADRIEVLSFGDRPLMTKDSRAAYAAAGSIAGMGMGFAIMMLFGLLDRSFRSAEDARKTTRMPLLGILPNLPEDLADPEQAAIAAHCVHQIRTLLQLSGGANKRIFAITSPAAGTGKTSLTLSLGVSFAASNCRTLIIDCDIIGGGLTARVDSIVRRKIGDILKRQGLVTDAQVQEALKLAEASHAKFGEILVELGFVKPADIEHALAMQHHDPVGMLDAIEGENLRECIAETGIERLCILPLGSAMPTDASKLSPSVIRSILEQARHHFDIVLIDTGPIPGSLEASVAAAAADGVLLVVSRGEHRPMAERSIQHLLDIGAHISGMVFNRADGRDMDLATTTKRLSSFDRRGDRSVPRQQRHPGEPTESKGFGPVALAVATKAPAHTNGTRSRS